MKQIDQLNKTFNELSINLTLKGEYRHEKDVLAGIQNNLRVMRYLQEAPTWAINDLMKKCDEFLDWISEEELNN